MKLLYPDNPNSEAGFSLIELMITMAVIAVTLFGFMGANILMERSGETAFEQSVAIQDANQVIERMRDASGNGQFPGNVTAAFAHNGLVPGFANLRAEQIRVSYVNTNADPLDVTVTVTWQNPSGRIMTTALRTLITQRT